MKTLDALNETEQQQMHRAVTDYLSRIDNGERVDRRKIMWQNPEIAEALEAYFETSDLVDQMAGPTLAESIAKAPTHSGAIQETVSPTGERTVGAAQATLPEQFGRYRIVRKLGEGAMGAVYLAFDNQLEREVALKTPSFENDATGELLERFYREAKSAGLLRHPGICPVHDVGKIDGIHYISMAYIEGRTLSSYIKAEKPQEERTIALLVRKLALALDEAHQKGVTHRDLKPANIMIDHRNEPVVMDFGLAYQADISDKLCRNATAALDDDESARQTRPNTILGSPAYMSPEQVESRLADIGPATDIYCLGVVLYELLTGQLPFNGSLAIVLAQIVGVDPDAPSTLRPGLDSRLQKICLKMMSKRIEDRYESMGEVAKALKPVLRKSKSAAETMVTEPSKPRAKVVQIGRKLLSRFAGNRKAAGILTLSILAPLLVLGGIVLLFQFRDATVRVEIDDPDIKVYVAGNEASRPRNDGETIKIKPGKQQLSIKYGGVEFTTNSFTLDRGSNPPLKVELRDKNKLVAWYGEKEIMRKALSLPVEPAPGPGSTRSEIPSVITAVRTFELGHTDDIRDIEFTPDGKRAVSVGIDSRLCYWDVDTGRLLDAFLVGGIDVAVSPDGRYATNGRVLIDLREKLDIRKFKSQGIVYSSEFFRDSNELATVSSEHDAPLLLQFWDVQTGKELKSINTGWNQRVPRGASIAITPDDRSVIVWRQITHDDGEKSLLIVDRVSGAIRRRVPLSAETLASGRSSLSPDGRQLLYSSFSSPVNLRGTILVNVATGMSRRSVGTMTWDAAWLPDGRHAVTMARDGGLYVWNTTDGKELARKRVCNTLFVGKVSPDGRFALTATGPQAAAGKPPADLDYRLHLWRLPQSVWPKQDAVAAAPEIPAPNPKPPVDGGHANSPPKTAKQPQQPPDTDVPKDILSVLPTIGVPPPTFIADEFLRGLVGIIARHQQQHPQGSSPKTSNSKRDIDPALKAANHLMLAKILIKNDKRKDAAKWVRKAKQEYDDCAMLLEELIKEHDGKPLAEQARAVLRLVKEVTLKEASK